MVSSLKQVKNSNQEDTIEYNRSRIYRNIDKRGIEEIGYELACEEGGCEPAKIAVTLIEEIQICGASEDWLTDFLGWARSADVTGDLCAQRRADVDFAEPCEQVLGSGHGIFPRRIGHLVTSWPCNPASCRCTV